MPVCKSCGAVVSISARDLTTGFCLDCLEARRRGVGVDVLRAERRATRERALRRWLEALYWYYGTTKQWPGPRYDELGQHKIPGDGFSRFVLTVGQILALAACALTVATAFQMLAMTGWVRANFPGVGGGATLWILFVGTITFVFWLALFLAFGRAKWVLRLVQCQQAMMARLLGRIGDAEAGEPPPVGGEPPPTGGGEVPPASPPPASPPPGGETPTAAGGAGREVPPTLTPPAPPRRAGERPPGDDLVLAVVETRMIMGGWIRVECDDGGWWVPPLREGQPVEIRRPDGTVVAAKIAGEERLVRTRRPGHLAFTLAGAVGMVELDGAVEVRIPLRGRD